MNLRGAAIRTVATGIHRAGLLPMLSRLAGHARREAGFPILVYHRVNDDRDPFFEALPTTVFERQMAFVAQAFTVLPLEDLVERMRRAKLPRNALAITFDDGYRDNLTHAAPILARHRLPATIFVASGFIGSSEAPWFDWLAWALKRTEVRRLAAPWGQSLPLVTLSDRLAALEVALDHLKAADDEERGRALDALLSALGAPDPAGFKTPMLTWDDVQALTGLGFSIGAHTVSHPILSRVPLERARAEIEGSRDMIASACGRRPRAFAYPNGQPRDYTDAVQRLVREAGFSCAVTTRFGLNTRHTPPHELRRGGPWEHDLPTFALKLAVYRAALS